MDGVVGVECRAPKAGALPGCATPRHYARWRFYCTFRLSSQRSKQRLCTNCANIAHIQVTVHNCPWPKPLKTKKCISRWALLGRSAACRKSRCALFAEDSKISIYSIPSEYARATSKETATLELAQESE